jgi:hypothetical protein
MISRIQNSPQHFILGAATQSSPLIDALNLDIQNGFARDSIRRQTTCFLNQESKWCRFKGKTKLCGARFGGWIAKHAHLFRKLHIAIRYKPTCVCLTKKESGMRVSERRLQPDATTTGNTHIATCIGLSCSNSPSSDILVDPVRFAGWRVKRFWNLR